MGFHGLPAFFVTVNPADLHHPLFCKLAGISVNLNERVPSGLPHASQRLYLVARNPTAAAKFFDTMVNAFIDIVLGMKYGGHGIFGKTVAYYAANETQGRGTLHTHIVVWIAGTLPPQALRNKMQTDEQYKIKLFNFLDTLITTALPSNTGVVPLAKAEFVRRADNVPHPSTRKCPHPDDIDYDEEWNAHLERLVLDTHFHQHNATCWKYLKPGQPENPKFCRMRINGSTRPETKIDPDTGSILLRRWHPEINQHNPILTMLLRCNHDIKFIGSGVGAKALIYYITDYVTKDTLPTDEAFAALAGLLERARDPLKGDSSHIVGSQDADNVTQHGLRFLTRACNALMACREVSAQEVALYFHRHGKSDHYANESYITIKWGNIWRWTIGQEKPAAEVSNAVAPEPDTMTTETPSIPNELDEDVVFDGSARKLATQLDDYRFRGLQFRHLGLYWFFACTNTVPLKQENVRLSTRQRNSTRASPRVRFLAEHPNHLTIVAKVREKLVIPCIVGPTLPRRDNEEHYGDYCKAMLLLFKPWRELTDLKSIDETWEHAFATWQFDQHSLDVMANFAALHECKDASDAYRDLRRRGVITHDIISEDVVNKAIESAKLQDDEGFQTWLQEHHAALQGVLTEPDDDEGDHDGELRPGVDGDIVISRQQVEKVVKAKALLSRVTSRIPPTPRSPETDLAEVSSEDLATEVMSLKVESDRLAKQMKTLVPQTESPTAPQPVDPAAYEIPELPSIHEIQAPEDDSVVSAPHIARRIVHQFLFNNEQEAAFGIIAEHHASKTEDQLVMFMVGPGGSGKSHVINGIEEYFNAMGQPQIIVKSGSTGVASALIHAETIHTLLGLNMVPPRHPQGKWLERLETLWRSKRYLVLDEVSMVGLVLLGRIGLRMQAIMGNNLPFGGLNVLFIGDPRQLPPVKDRALWSDPEYAAKSDTARGQHEAHGRYLWSLATTVVTLTQNYRQRGDPVYQQIIQRCGEGCATKLDCKTLRSRILGNARVPDDIFDIPLITSDKSVRDEWNSLAVKHHAAVAGQELHTYVALDRETHGKRLQGQRRDRVLQLSSSETQDRLGRLPLFVGMKVVVLTNILTKGGVVNGAEGVVTRITYRYLASGDRVAECVFVAVHGCSVQFPGLDAGVVPIFPASSYISVRLKNQSTMKVRRDQIPLLPAYAFTDYKSQGRTMFRAILDLASSRLKRESIYVLLTRVVSLENIYILREFPDSVITSRLSTTSRSYIDSLRAMHVKSVLTWRSTLMHTYIHAPVTPDATA